MRMGEHVGERGCVGEKKCVLAEEACWGEKVCLAEEACWGESVFG